jgi:hypothetical protein
MTARTSVPDRPAISDILIKASANGTFRARLLNSPHDALTEFEVPPEDVAILTGVRASNLKDFAQQIKLRLLHNYSSLN